MPPVENAQVRHPFGQLPPDRPPTDRPPMKNIRDNWLSILIAIGGSIAINFFSLGSKATSIDNAIAANARAIDAIRMTSPDQTKWQTEQNTQAINSIRASAQVTDEKVGQINSKLAGIDVKLDFIKESVSNRH